MLDWPAVNTLRKRLRVELIAAREGLPRTQRREANEHITALLEAGFPSLRAMVIGFCWPHRHEVDTRFAIHHFRRQGAVAALPAVVAKGMPLEFRQWAPGVEMKPEVYGIPVPQGTPVMRLDAALVPMNGFDAAGYRLGYGGGYFDRTLASCFPKPITIGVTYECARLPTIHAQPHDIPMDFVVTEAGISLVDDDSLRPLSPAAAAARCAELACERGLPGPRAAPLVASREAASPPCYAQEFPEYFGGSAAPLNTQLVATLNTLLEAERAGAKVLAAYMTGVPRESPLTGLMHRIQRDEAQNCASLIEAIVDLNGTPSTAVGDFYRKALEVEGLASRLVFLNRGQSWVVRRIAETLPGLAAGPLRRMLEEMHASHMANIAACDEALGVLPDAAGSTRG